MDASIKTPASLSDLANEILLHIFHSLHSISDCLALAATNRHFQSLLASSHRIPILYDAAEAQYGPLNDAIRLITHNSTQAPHVPRSLPPQSFALLQQIIEVGRVANKWVATYPIKKWRGEDSVLRRFLTTSEEYKLRRACYRSWLYTLAFHTPSSPRTARLSPPVVLGRAALLRRWSTTQLAELLDLQGIFRQVLQLTICPSNSTVMQRHKARFPHDPLPLYAITQPDRWAREHALYHHRTHFHSTPHMSNLLSSSSPMPYHQHQNHRNAHGLGSGIAKTSNTNDYGLTLEGWGDEIAHYYVIEDMLKLDPGQLMYLFESITDALGPNGNFNAGWSSKGLVESFLAGAVRDGSTHRTINGVRGGGGDWFENNGETLAETIGFVFGERGGDALDLRDGVEDGILGITCEEDLQRRI